MTANDLYQLFVGEIGIPRREFLYEITFWEARRIVRGYRNRFRDMWSATRWLAYSIMSAIPFCDLTKAGIHKSGDLIRFPWDSDRQAELPSDDEIEDMAQELQRLNEIRKQKK